ncbi:RAP domain-containing protein [Toxoplasma gondii TgCatPRC2]|uniref:RAP domain-containing protein n=1 Tax=Toxoplasma gondii TgCatPRC2 TaxID=1130821 RepID=A0A151GZS3_TOXGO|nr:RAP domain-containing protein [Toxoplasma gondii TgCatPRC2]
MHIPVCLFPPFCERRALQKHGDCWRLKITEWRSPPHSPLLHAPRLDAWVASRHRPSCLSSSRGSSFWTPRRQSDARGGLLSLPVFDSWLPTRPLRSPDFCSSSGMSEGFRFPERERRRPVVDSCPYAFSPLSSSASSASSRSLASQVFLPSSVSFFAFSVSGCAFASCRPSCSGLSPLSGGTSAPSPSQLKTRAKSLLQRLQSLASNEAGEETAPIRIPEKGSQRLTRLHAKLGTEREQGNRDEAATQGASSVISGPAQSPNREQRNGRERDDSEAGKSQALEDGDLLFLLHNLSLFSPSDLLLLLAALVRWTERSAACASTVSPSKGPLSPLAAPLPPTVGPLMREVVSQLGTQLALLPNFPTTALLCGDLVRSSPVRDTPRFWEAFFRFFLSSAQLKSTGSVGIHGSSLALSSASQLMQLLSFLASLKNQADQTHCRPSEGRTGDRERDSEACMQRGSASGAGEAAEGTEARHTRAEVNGGDKRADSRGFCSPDLSPEEKNATRGDKRGCSGEGEVTKGSESDGVLRDGRLGDSSPSDALALPSAPASLSFLLLGSGRSHRPTQEAALLDRLVAALCSRLAVQTVLETLSPRGLIRLLLLLADLKAKHVPLLTEVAALLKPLCPDAVDSTTSAKTPVRKGAVASRSPLRVSAGAIPPSRGASLSLEDDEQFVTRVQACGLNRLFRPADLAVLIVSFAALEAHEFQPLLRGAADVLSVHTRDLSLPLMVSTLDSCSRIKFYPQRLAEALLRSLPPELMKSHTDDNSGSSVGESARVHHSGESARDGHRSSSAETRQDGRNELLEMPDTSIFSPLSVSSLAWRAGSPGAPLSLAERHQAAAAVPVLLKALARLNVRHKATVKAALSSLKQPDSHQTRASLPPSLTASTHGSVLLENGGSASPASPTSVGSPGGTSSDQTQRGGACPHDKASEGAGGLETNENAGDTRKKNCSFVPSFSVLPSARNTAALVYALYRLDVWDPQAVRSSLASLESLGGAELVARLGLKGCANVLLAASYFSCAGPKLYDEILPHMLPMETKLTKEGVSQLKIVELACRVGHLPFSFKTLSAASRDLLLRIRSCDLEPEEVCVSGLQREVSSTARTVGYHCFTEVQVGPYTLDFVKPVTQEDLVQMAMEEEARKSIPGFRRPLRHIDDPFEHELDIKGVVLEVDGPQHFYRDSFHWTSASKLKHRLLAGLGFRIAHVPYFDWLELHTEDVRRVYLRCALERALSPSRGDDLERWAPHAASCGLRKTPLSKSYVSEETSVSSDLAFDGDPASTRFDAAKGNVGESNARVLTAEQGDPDTIEKGKQIRDPFSFAPAPFLNAHERALLHERKHGDAMKSKKIALAIYKRERDRKKRERKEEQRRKIVALQNNPRNYKIGSS